MHTVTALRAATGGRSRRFLRHLLEMTAAMMVGMVAYGVVLGTVLARSGQTVEDARVDRPELFALGMATAMAVPMVAWMRRRGHGWRNGAEMTAAMFVPAVALIVCYRLDAVSAAAICPIACATMIPAMAAAMVVRLDDYTGHGR
ncbi:MAG: hypothetical protein ACM33B_10550 [Pseudomonadota bacterium]